LAGERFIVSDSAPGPEITITLFNASRISAITLRYTHSALVGTISCRLSRWVEAALTSEATTVAQIPGITYRPVANGFFHFARYGRRGTIIPHVGDCLASRGQWLWWCGRGQPSSEIS
jgi:hypothetical protein